MIRNRAASTHNCFLHAGFSRKLLPVCVAAFIWLLLSAPGVLAQTNVDFECSLSPTTHCTGTVVRSGSNFSTTGISVFNDSGPYATTPANHFTLAFNTLTGTISLDGTGAFTGQNLVGHIVSFNSAIGGTTTTVNFVVDWPTLPSAVEAQLGSATGTDAGFVIALTSTGATQSVDVLITPTPELPTFFLFMGGIVLVAIKSLRPR
jgi:hypothetical protein